MAKKNVDNSSTGLSARIEVFRPGTFTAMNGETVTYSADDLAALAAGYDPDNSPAPIVVGHPTSDSPAYGWVKGFDFDLEANRLYADIDQLEPAFADAVRAGRYKRISMSFYKPDSTSNPKPESIYPKHIGFLGGAAPAVSGLKPVEFKGDDTDAVTVEFGDAAFRDVAGIFTKLREFLIEQFGRETADNTVPGYLVNWIDEAGGDPEPEEFSNTETEDDDMADKESKGKAPSDDFAKRETKLAAREKRIADQEAAQAHADHESFADQLIADGRLVTGLKPKLVTLMDAVATDETEHEFADGEGTAKANPLVLLQDILKAQPKMVEFTETDMSGEPVDESDSEALAGAALSYQGAQDALGVYVSTADAVEHVLKTKGATS